MAGGGGAKVTSHGAFQGENPLDYALPLLILQICLVIVVTRGLAYLLRPLRQPRVIAEIIGGILLGPSALGRSTKFLDAVFPARSMVVLDTLANIGLLFFLFLVGLELDLNAIRRTGRKALAISLSGIAVPFAIGTSFAFRATIVPDAPHAPFLVFMGVALSITAFPVLARILTELKLLTTDLGRMAMSAAAVDDVTAWVLLALAIALSGSGSPIISLWVMLTAIGFVAAVFLLLRPVLAWMARRSPDGEPVKEIYIVATLAVVLAASFVTDVIGIHALFGAFMVGIVVPKDGPFAGVLIEKVEELISGLFLPLYFVSSGLKTNVATIRGAKSWGLLVLVILNACVGKIGGAVGTCLLLKVPLREAFTIGFLMNTKGLVELVVLNIGRERKVLNDEAFAIMVLMALFTTFITTPIVMAVYKPARPSVPYKRRTVECAAAEEDSELRVLACFHGNRNIPTLLNLVELSRGTRRHRLVMYAMHLVELTERSSAISMVHRALRNGMPFFNMGRQSQPSSETTEVAFEAFQQLSSVRVRPTTAISDLDTIHRDVIDSAAAKRAAVVIMPYHKTLQHDGSFHSVGSAYHAVNKRVLREAPCSVAILVDRGLGGHSQVSAKNVAFSVAMLFFGGADDREALAYASRMAEHPGVAVTLARFHPSLPLSDEESAADEAAVEAFKSKVGSAKEDGSTRFEEVTACAKEAPCSVALLVDRGLGGHSQVSAKNVAFSVAVLFFGGPDDREALAYVARMAEHPGVAVTLARLQPNRPVHEDADDDEAAVEAFKSRVAGASKDGSVQFEEREPPSPAAPCSREEVVEMIESLSRCNVFVVGRMPPVAPLVEDPDELGPVGSYLVLPGFSTSASVLVIKRYDPATNPKSRRFDPKARPPPATDVDEEATISGSATVVPVPSSPSP